MRRSLHSFSSRASRVEVRTGLWLDSRLALWIVEARLLVVADLHWGYAASHRARGSLLPMWGDDEIVHRLQSLITDYQPTEMLWLGDVVHAAEGAAHAEAFLRTAPLPITILAGNHDRRWASARDKTKALRRDCYLFHHGDIPSQRASDCATASPIDATPQSAPAPLHPQSVEIPSGCLEIIGHHHPAAAIGDAAGSQLKLPALASSPDRIILPAFSPWAAGTVWNDRLSLDETLWVISSARIFPLRRPSAAVHPPPLS